jgi:predicted Fe-Mo cluster-binding NifX family protein
VKIIITSKGKCLTDELDPRFGRCANFIVYDADSGEFEAIENTNAAMAGGAGIQTAQLAVSKGAGAVISGSFGPNAYNTLKAAGVEMYSSGEVKVIQAVMSFKEGKLPKVSEAGISKKI